MSSSIPATSFPGSVSPITPPVKKNSRDHTGRIKSFPPEIEQAEDLHLTHNGNEDEDEDEPQSDPKAKDNRYHATDLREYAKKKGEDGKPVCILAGRFSKEPAVPIYVVRRGGVFKKSSLRFLTLPGDNTKIGSSNNNIAMKNVKLLPEYDQGDLQKSADFLRTLLSDSLRENVDRVSKKIKRNTIDKENASEVTDSERNIDDSEDDSRTSYSDFLGHRRSRLSRYTSTEYGKSDKNDGLEVQDHDFPAIDPMVELGTSFLTAVQRHYEDKLMVMTEKIKKKLEVSQRNEKLLHNLIKAANEQIKDQKLVNQRLEKEIQAREFANPKNMELARNLTDEEANTLELSYDKAMERIVTLKRFNEQLQSRAVEGREATTSEFWDVKLKDDIFSSQNAQYIKGPRGSKLYQWDGKYWCDQKIRHLAVLRVVKISESEEDQIVEGCITVEGVAYLESRTDKGMLMRLAAKGNIERDTDGNTWLVGVIRNQVFVPAN